MTDSQITILQLPLGPLQTNCYLLACARTAAAAVIDPSWSGERIAREAEERGWQITHILLTHSHFDHVGGLAALKEQTGAPIYLHPQAVEMLRNAPMAARLWQIPIPEPPPADVMLAAGQAVAVGDIDLEVRYAPGHAPGHVCFYAPGHQVLFAGDVLFQGSIGRTDLPGGDYELLMRSITEQLLPLPDETRVFSGHGPATTIGRERRANPFLTQ